MNEFCDRCAAPACGECSEGSGKLSERIKGEIAKNLAAFLVSDKHLPEEIVVTVRYPQSTAKLNIDTHDIERAMTEAPEERV